MSTKATIKHLWDDENQTGYHLFTDHWIHSCLTMRMATNLITLSEWR